MKRRVVLAQMGWCYDDEVWLPTAAGMLAAHCRASDEFNAAYEIDPWLRYERVDPGQFVDSVSPVPDVVALSHYVWNEQINFAVLREVKRWFPNALTVLGGPSVGDAGPLAEKLLRDHPEVDVLVHGEGEETFRELLLEGFMGTAGISCLLDRKTYHAEPPRPRRKNLDDFASPFLAGTFDHVLAMAAAKGQRFSAVWEPDRGCPFSCTFCNWGSATAAKVNTFGMERLLAELDWFQENEIGFIYGASANFGLLFDRDIALARHMAALKRATGYPQRFMVNTSKNATERIFQLSKLLHDAGLSKGATLSMQSWDAQTLVAIGRNNIKLSTYTKLQALFKSEGIPTYAELILGLPGESLASFCDGIDKNLDAGQHDGLFIYLCRVLAGTEMAEPDYRALYGIETVRLPIQANHGNLNAATVGPTEYEETVVATKTMAHADWLEAQRIAWFVEVFFVLGIARLPLLWLREQGVKVTEFARWAWTEMGRGDRDGLTYPRLCGEWHRLVGYLASQDAGTPEVPNDGIRGLRLDAFPAIRWPIEEATLLALLAQRDEAFAEIGQLCTAFCEARSIGVVGLSATVAANKQRMLHWTTDPEFTTPSEFAKHRVWFGRRGGSLLR